MSVVPSRDGSYVSETWREISEFPGNYVSDLGRVKSARGKLLTLQTDRDGYRAVGISIGNQRQARRLVHRLVLAAFVGAAPDDKPEGAHLDNDPSNNQLANLTWASRLENEAHKDASDRRPRGDDHYRRLPESIRADIKKRRADGETFAQIAIACHVGVTTAWRISHEEMQS